MANDPGIHDRLNRVEEIVGQLDVDKYDLDEWTALYEEGQQLLDEVRSLLDDGSGDVVQIE
ncbi:exodeoxyribonuclease VII small subunit [Natrinema gari]|uniref:Exonuclease VII small subunit n=1 Tax=Natrinema gari JCM 14663 TaxID=1230459 RepID=L9YSG8_9EURY|nr:exodeoxyribonuclease VII small subunit [Natrinema gari]ELY77165.1 Exonuclease VII small subunit [Natrinema gari JCM 14663]